LVITEAFLLLLLLLMMMMFSVAEDAKSTS